MMRRVLILLVGAMWAAGAVAQIKDCTQVPAGYRSRCEEINHLRELCSAFTGLERNTCVEKNVHYARMKSDCSMAKTPEKQARCANHNHEMDLLAPCSGKTGDAFRACAEAAGVHGPGNASPAPSATPAPAPKPAPAGTPAPKTAANVVPDPSSVVTPNAAPGAAPK